MITKVDLYNAPYEIASADRFYKDIDTKLNARYYVGNVKDFSFTINSTTEMVLTLTGPQRGSYARIESSLFGGKPSYWFLTAISEVESDEGTRYAATLDAIATHGEEVFARLQGKKIKIDRLHEDRYVLEGSNFKLNGKVHGLINTDFKVPDTKGVELVIKGGDAGDLTGNRIIAGGYSNKIDYTGLELKGKDIIIDNMITQGSGNGTKRYWLYALMQDKGDPQVYTVPKVEKAANGKVYTRNDDMKQDNNSALRTTVLLPVSKEINGLNGITTLSRLQEGKIINIIKSPIKITSSLNGVQMLFNEKGERYTHTKIDNNSGNPGELPSYRLLKPDNSDVLLSGTLIDPMSITPGFDIGDFELINEIVYYKDITSIDSAISDISNGLHFEIVPYELGAKGVQENIMDFIAYIKDSVGMRAIVNSGETERLEVGLLNPDIMPINFKVHDIDKEIDMYNYFNHPNLNGSFAGLFTFNEMGLDIAIKLSENQFVQWGENQIMSFFTDQGSTYLARNKYSNDAQRKAADLNAEMQKNQIKLGQAQQYGGGIMGGALSMLNPANWAASAIRGQQNEIVDKIADNKKQQIQATINDASATSPSVHTGSTFNLADLNNLEFKNNFNWIMKKPNKFLLNKIAEFYDRHGYIIHDWLIFNSSMIENRSKFNYIEIDEFKDFIGTFSMFDINVLNLLDKEFKKGLRLWHENVIDYNNPNLEKIITENI